MKIRVDWYKPSGKWYAGGEVEVDDSRLYFDDFLQKIVDNQNELIDGWQGGYDVVTSDTEENYADQNYTLFYKALFHRDRFLRIKRKNC